MLSPLKMQKNVRVWPLAVAIFNMPKSIKEIKIKQKCGSITNDWVNFGQKRVGTRQQSNAPSEIPPFIQDFSVKAFQLSTTAIAT